MDWLAKLLGLPETFLHHHPESRGGGVLQVGLMRAQEGVLLNCFATTQNCFFSAQTELPLQSEMGKVLPVAKSPGCGLCGIYDISLWNC